MVDWLFPIVLSLLSCISALLSAYDGWMLVHAPPSLFSALVSLIEVRRHHRAALNLFKDDALHPADG